MNIIKIEPQIKYPGSTYNRHMAAEVIDKAFKQQNFGVQPMGIFEPFFDSVGMMRGSMAPLWRAGFGIALGSILVFALRPPFMFDARGSPRPFIFFDQQNPNATLIPWYAPPIFLGLFFSVFV